MSESKDTSYLRQTTGTTEMEYDPYMKAVLRVCDEADALRAQLAASEQALADSREARNIEVKNLMDGLSAYEEQVLSLEQALAKCREETAAALHAVEEMRTTAMFWESSCNNVEKRAIAAEQKNAELEARVARLTAEIGRD